jgi:small acid-soluble spore protein I (minor)
MITMSLREAIIKRVQDRDEEELMAIINDSVHADERALPGLGVLFEIIWDHLEPSVKNQLVSELKQHLPTT